MNLSKQRLNGALTSLSMHNLRTSNLRASKLGTKPGNMSFRAAFALSMSVLFASSLIGCGQKRDLYLTAPQANSESSSTEQSDALAEEYEEESDKPSESATVTPD